jgi:hypothetical protein
MSKLLTNLKNYLSNMKKTPSKSSPRGGKRGCLCDDGKYSKDCCNGDLQNQGIGSLVQSGTQIVNNTNTTRTIVG